MTSLTKEQALDEGYTLCGFADKDYQSLMNIVDMTSDEINNAKLVIADKEPIRPSITAETIKEMIAETMESDWGNDTLDDTEEVYKRINKLDFTETANMVNKSVENVICYRLTKIQLTA